MSAASEQALAEDPAKCATCHTPQAEFLAGSVHKDIHCRECHGGAESYSLTPEQAHTFRTPASLGTRRPMFDHGQDFRGKAKRSDVPNLCGGCHADVARMNSYGLPTDQLAAYWTSGHGKALKENGDENVAVCIDCHGSHDVLGSSDPGSKTYPSNVPDMCGGCHADEKLMSGYDWPVEIVAEYKQSVHGDLLLNQNDLGAPNCATCHGSHAATPPGFDSVASVCGRCHQHASDNFKTSIHATQEEFKGCVQCHGGGPDAHFHLIEHITKPTGLLIQRYAHLLASEPSATDGEIKPPTHADPVEMITRALPSCTECHEELEEDESLPKMFKLLDAIASAERKYVQTAHRLDEVSQGVLLVDNQRFRFEEARTHLIALAPLQHTLDNDLVAKKVADLNRVCDEVQAELADLENGLRWRYRALYPIWGFAILFAIALYVKYKRLKAQYVTPLEESGGASGKVQKP